MKKHCSSLPTLHPVIVLSFVLGFIGIVGGWFSWYSNRFYRDVETNHYFGYRLFFCSVPSTFFLVFLPRCLLFSNGKILQFNEFKKMILFLFSTLSQLESAQIDITPFSARSKNTRRRSNTSIVFRLKQATWLGYRTNKWYFLSSVEYDVWEYRSWSQEDYGLEKFSQIKLRNFIVLKQFLLTLV